MYLTQRLWPMALNRGVESTREQAFVYIFLIQQKLDNESNIYEK